MELNKVNQFEVMSNEELTQTEGGGIITILKTGYKVVKFTWHYRHDIAEGLVDGWSNSGAYGM